MKFGATLKEIRKERNFTQRELAVEMGMDPGYLSRLERDSHLPGLEALENIVGVLQVTPTQRDRLYAAAKKLPPEVADKVFCNGLAWFALIRKGLPKTRRLE